MYSEARSCFRYPKAKSEAARFEEEAAELLGVKYALMVNSGTSALISALTGVGVGPGDEVIVPGYTYISTAAAVMATGAVPVIAEIDESLGLDPQDLERKITPHTRAVMPVHMRGVPARLDDILAVARKHGLKVVEDCCQCVGGTYMGRSVGAYGDAGAWSLNYYKTISSGEGGLVFTNDRDIYERACFAADPGLPMWTASDEDVEWRNEPFPRQTYRTSEVLAAIARAQLSKLDDILERQRSLKQAFFEGLEEARAYRIQHVDDPDGDTGVSASVIVHDKELAVGYAHALNAEGRPGGHGVQRRLPGQAHLHVLGLDTGEAFPSSLGIPLERPELQGKRRVLQGHVPSDSGHPGTQPAVRLQHEHDGRARAAHG